MALIVQKFGGTSVGSVERIEAVAEKIISFRDRGDDVVVVVSAMSGETNRLTALAQEMMEQPTAREMDVLLSTGEQVTIALLSMVHGFMPTVSHPDGRFYGRDALLGDFRFDSILYIYMANDYIPYLNWQTRWCVNTTHSCI